MSMPRGFCLVAAAILSVAGVHSAETPRPVDDETPFTYESMQRRDPFTFRNEFISFHYLQPLPPPLPMPQAKKEDVLAEKLRAAGLKYTLAEKALIDLQPASVVESADEALKLFKGFESDVRVGELRERLIRIRNAGVRMKNREDAQSEFSRLNIRVTGVVAKERQSQAIINAKDTRIVGKGDLISINENQEVIVDDILPEQVIVLFKGYKMILTMAEQQTK